MSFLLPEAFKKLPQGEQNRLLQDAIKPLTPAEVEVRDGNTQSAITMAEVREIAKEIAEARSRFCVDSIRSIVRKGDVPEWIGNPDKAKEATGWLRERGYRFELYRHDPLRMRFYKGESMLGEMVIQ